MLWMNAAADELVGLLSAVRRGGWWLSVGSWQLSVGCWQCAIFPDSDKVSSSAVRTNPVGAWVVGSGLLVLGSCQLLVFGSFFDLKKDAQ